MDSLMLKWGLIFKALAITALLLIVRLAIDFAGMDILAVTNLITAFVGGAIFTIAIILTGTLADFKESERIPGELVTALSALHADTGLVGQRHAETAAVIRSHALGLLKAITENFRNNVWNQEGIRKEIGTINEKIYELADTSIAAPLLVKLRTELINIERLSNRIAVIKHTSFIPAAYTIAELAAAGVIGILFFAKIEPWYEGLVLFGVLSALLISLILLIKDMDDPFEVGKKSYADVDLSIVFDLEKEWESKAAGKK
ncbi:MAG: hypothetical protein LLF84_09250 [Methanoregulaceae archaeon]|nr:hypothetical protein [Methanoregulaceae archaeon]